MTDPLANRLASVQAQITELTALEITLRTLLERARGDAPEPTADVCWILEAGG